MKTNVGPIEERQAQSSRTKCLRFQSRSVKMTLSNSHRTKVTARDRPRRGENQETRLASGLHDLLLGLAKHLLPAGITPRYFGELAYRAFVEAAADISRCRNGRVNRSRVAVLTALRRAEVTRLLLERGTSSPLYGAYQQRTDRVIAAWIADRRYVDARGLPRTLPLQGRSSFTTLVKEFAGDVPPRAVIEELRRLHVVRENRGCMNLIGSRRVSKRSADQALLELIDMLLDGLEIVANGDASEPSSHLHRVALRASDSLELKMMRQRANSGANAFLEGLQRSLNAPPGPTRSTKRMSRQLTIAVLVREHPSTRRKGTKR